MRKSPSQPAVEKNQPARYGRHTRWSRRTERFRSADRRARTRKGYAASVRLLRRKPLRRRAGVPSAKRRTVKTNRFAQIRRFPDYRVGLRPPRNDTEDNPVCHCEACKASRGNLIVQTSGVCTDLVVPTHGAPSGRDLRSGCGRRFVGHDHRACRNFHSVRSTPQLFTLSP